MSKTDELLKEITDFVLLHPETEETKTMVVELIHKNTILRSFIEVYKRTCEISLNTGDANTLYKAACRVLNFDDTYNFEPVDLQKKCIDIIKNLPTQVGKNEDILIGQPKFHPPT